MTTDIHRATEAVLIQMREMKLTPEELERLTEKYRDAPSPAAAAIFAAASLLALETAFAKG